MNFLIMFGSLGVLLFVSLAAVIPATVILVKRTTEYTEESGEGAVLKIFRWAMFLSLIVNMGVLSLVFLTLFVVSYITSKWITDHVKRVDHVRLMACTPLLALILGIFI